MATRRLAANISDLFVACHHSISDSDATIATQPMRRIVAFTIWVDGPQAGRIGTQLGAVARKALEEAGFDIVRRWGPHRGSSHITLFGRSQKAEDQPSFEKRLHLLTAKFQIFLQKVTWRKYAKRSGSVIQIVCHIGKIGLFFTIANARPDLQLFILPPLALQMLAVSSEVVGIAREVGQLISTAPRRSLPEPSETTEASVTRPAPVTSPETVPSPAETSSGRNRPAGQRLRTRLT